MCVSFLPNLESVKCLECKAFAQFFVKSFLTSNLEKKGERVLFHLEFFKSLRLLRSGTSWGLDFKFRKNVRNWLKSESVWNSFYLCFYITLCLWCQFLFRNNNRGSILLFFLQVFMKVLGKNYQTFYLCKWCMYQERLKVSPFAWNILCNFQN